MIQFNLLPDVKLEYIKAQRAQRLVWAVAFLASSISIALLLLLVGLNGLQKKHLNDLSGDITTKSKKLKAEPQISKILTVQNQLESLTALHDAKPATSRLFDYLNQTTPASVSISNFTIDMTTQIVAITGTTDALSTVNRYVDTLKFTTYTADGGTKAAAFGNVVLTSFGLSPGQQGSTPSASYMINLNYDKNIFDATKVIKLTVPKLTTTRSEISAPPDLFQAAPTASAPASTPPATTKASN